ncbi:extracellular solute-binding protein family 3 [Gloeothece citriformis PCC 7424]|uniref:Extracellular solute-binding protein family 3 n=1 Tax=Gloeothece citriformis (strain PCC 7424) TaxID=65393 RepID=B7K9G6_GLOC7|nr:transporter substrate-binding domain-containing protein [Gloeothece citriformis]ACK68649.1 extracellular solute-binding protein family 3 [Gloeothece citriformis PCC 7424]
MVKLGNLFPFSIALVLVTTSLISSSSILAAPLDEIMRRGKLIVGIKDNVKPLGFKNEQGDLQGFEIDIAQRLAQEILGSPDALVLRPVNNLERLEVVIEGTVDITIARVTITPSRSRVVDMSHYYYLDGTGLVTKNPSMRSLSDVTSARIALLKNSSTIVAIKSELPNAQLIGVNSYQEALTLLETNQADVFAADNSILAGWVQDYPQYRLLPVRLSGAALSIVMPKGLQYKSLHNRVNEAIARWQESGWLQERATYWGLP